MVGSTIVITQALSKVKGEEMADAIVLMLGLFLYLTIPIFIIIFSWFAIGRIIAKPLREDSKLLVLVVQFIFASLSAFILIHTYLVGLGKLSALITK